MADGASRWKCRAASEIRFATVIRRPHRSERTAGRPPVWLVMIWARIGFVRDMKNPQGSTIDLNLASLCQWGMNAPEKQENQPDRAAEHDGRDVDARHMTIANVEFAPPSLRFEDNRAKMTKFLLSREISGNSTSKTGNKAGQDECPPLVQNAAVPVETQAWNRAEDAFRQGQNHLEAPVNCGIHLFVMLRIHFASNTPSSGFASPAET